MFVQAEHAEASKPLTPPMSGGGQHNPSAPDDTGAGVEGRLRLRRRAPPGAVVTARLRDVRHMPAPFDPSQPRQTLPFLCESFYATGLCPGAGACPDVHVDPGRVLAMAAHVRMVQPQPEPERLGAAGYALLVAPAHGVSRGGGGGGSSKLFPVDAGQCLPTRALRTTRPRRTSHADGISGSRPLPALRLCTHFAGDKGVCDYGVECRFVHWLGPNAPAPGDNCGSAVAVTTPAGSDCGDHHPELLKARYRHEPYCIGSNNPGWTRRRESPPPPQQQ
jgi:hypothetical protein